MQSLLQEGLEVRAQRQGRGRLVGVREDGHAVDPWDVAQPHLVDELGEVTLLRLAGGGDQLPAALPGLCG